MSQTPPEELDDALDPNVPDLSGEADNQPDDAAPVPDAEVQDPEGTEFPEVHKHSDGGVA